MKMKLNYSRKMALLVLLAGCMVGWSVRADAPPTWVKNCQSCHGKDGKGDTMMGRKLSIKDLTDPKIQAGFSDADATKAIKEGVKDSGTEKMKAFGSKLSDDDVKALVAYVRTLK